MRELPDQVARTLDLNDGVAAIAREGPRHHRRPVPRAAHGISGGAERPLKLKELSYLHAEGTRPAS